METLYDIPTAPRALLLTGFLGLLSRYIYSLSKLLPIGWRRGVVALCMVVIHCGTGFLFSSEEEVTTKTVMLFNYMWLASFKVLLCMHH